MLLHRTECHQTLLRSVTFLSAVMITKQLSRSGGIATSDNIDLWAQNSNLHRTDRLGKRKGIVRAKGTIEILFKQTKPQMRWDTVWLWFLQFLSFSMQFLGGCIFPHFLRFENCMNIRMGKINVRKGKRKKEILPSAQHNMHKIYNSV